MGKIDSVLEKSYGRMKTQYPGEFLLDNFKEAMLEQRVFKALFGEEGQRIWINEEKSLNDTSVPLVRLRYQSDTYQNRDVYLTGTLDGVVIFPAKLKGRVDVFRKMGGVFQRWLGSDKHGLFDSVPGLLMIGQGSTWRYDSLAQYSGEVYPAMPFTLPYEFDLQLFGLAMPEVDLTADLDSDPLGFIETYEVALQSDQDSILLEVTSQTLQGNDDE